MSSAEILELAIDYLPVAIFFAIAFAVSAALVWLGREREGTSDPDWAERWLDYASTSTNDLRIVLGTVLFVSALLGVSILFPWAISLRDTGLVGYAIGIVFLATLAIGLLYLYRLGALDWDEPDIDDPLQ